MTELTAEYNSTESGWKTEIVELEGNIYLMVELNTMGYIVIKQLDEATDTYPKILVTPRCNDAKLRLIGGKGRKIIILTSEEPKSIKYGNI